MVPALFTFAQFEYPWELGPADGRYLVRSAAQAEAEHVVVLATLGARRRHLVRRPPRRARRVGPEPEATPVAVARVTVIDAAPARDEAAARSWLADAGEAQAQAALDIVDHLIYVQRIATADPHLHAPSIHQALAVRVGWGDGEQVAEGRWRDARELPASSGRRARRTAVLRPQERLALLLGARDRPLLGEELLLRARLDFDQGRVSHAAIELQGAYATLVPALAAEGRADLAGRVRELEELAGGVAAAARAAVAGAGGAGAGAGESEREGNGEREGEGEGEGEAGVDEGALSHALGRLEAALRARAASGFSTSS